MLSVVILNVAFYCYSEWNYAAFRYAECHDSKCRYAEYRGAMLVKYLRMIVKN
jgi:hypothetical protein